MNVELTLGIKEYGYWAVFLGTLIEGETAAFISGIAAHNQWLSYPPTLLFATLGGIVSDNLLFLVGRYFGPQILHLLHHDEAKTDRISQFIRRKENLTIIGVRFVYGLRTVGPIILGMHQVSPLKFFTFNIIGGAVWGSVFVSMGYFISAFVLSLPIYSYPLGLAIVGVFLYFLYKRKNTFK